MCTAWYPLRYAAVFDNYRLRIITKRSIFTGEMITLIMTEVNRYAFDENMREKNDFYIFVPSDLDL